MVRGSDLENNARTVHLHHPRISAHAKPGRRGSLMANIDGYSDAGVRVRHHVRKRVACCGLEQRNEARRGQHRYITATDGIGGISRRDDHLGGAREPYGDIHQQR